MPRASLRSIVAPAIAGGAAWGAVMAMLAFRSEGAEVVLLQAWILCPAWLLGRAAGDPLTGALAGLAVVAAAIWTYELLPGWGIEAALEGRGAPPTEIAALTLEFDRDDIVLLTTHLAGLLAGLGGGLRPQPEEREATAAPPEPPPDPGPLTAPPPPLWAPLEPPPPPAPQPLPPAVAPVARRAIGTPWGSAFLLAALATDLLLDRLFGLYTREQGLAAIAFAAAGVAVTAALARRYALAMLLAGAVLAAGFAAVQDAEYRARADLRVIQ